MHNSSYKVYYEDTDAGGVVYYANYLKFAERARTDWLDYVGVNQKELIENDKIAFVVSEVNAKYKGAAKLGDIIEIETKLVDSTKISFNFVQILKIGSNIINEMEVKVICVTLKDDGSFRPTKIPVNIIELIK